MEKESKRGGTRYTERNDESAASFRQDNSTFFFSYTAQRSLQISSSRSLSVCPLRGNAICNLPCVRRNVMMIHTRKVIRLGRAPLAKSQEYHSLA